MKFSQFLIKGAPFLVWLEIVTFIALNLQSYIYSAERNTMTDHWHSGSQCQWHYHFLRFLTKSFWKLLGITYHSNLQKKIVGTINIVVCAPSGQWSVMVYLFLYCIMLLQSYYHFEIIQKHLIFGHYLEYKTYENVPQDYAPQQES